MRNLCMLAVVNKFEFYTAFYTLRKYTLMQGQG